MTDPAVRLSEAQWELLFDLQKSADGGAFAVACDGKLRDHANQLDAKGLADWRGTSWGSSFYSITPAGRAALTQGRETER